MTGPKKLASVTDGVENLFARRYRPEGRQAGGATGAFPATGKEFGPALLRLGFHEITVENPDTFNFMSGDVMVMDPRKNTTEGHIAGYDGENWISDFIQRDFWAGKDYRTERPHYAVYRY